jgi:RNA recognition motif-containing protein
MRDPHTKDSRGFAFVTMEIAEEAETAISQLNATELMGRVMNVEKARRGRARTREFLLPPFFSPRLNFAKSDTAILSFF